jgi:hypothetical protein
VRDEVDFLRLEVGVLAQLIRAFPLVHVSRERIWFTGQRMPHSDKNQKTTNKEEHLLSGALRYCDLKPCVLRRSSRCTQRLLL